MGMSVNLPGDEFSMPGLAYLKSVYSVVLLVVVWEVVAQLGLVYYAFLPPFSDVLVRLVSLSLSGELVFHAFVTLRRAFAGLLLAIAVGTLVGLLMGRSRSARWFFEPLVNFGYPIPKISLIPVFILWFGIGDLAKVLLVATDCVFPIVVNTYRGAESVDEKLVWSAEMMGSSRRRRFRRVILPAALPDVLTGIQIALPISLIVTFVFEMISGGVGLGSLEIQGVREFEPTIVFATLIAIMVIGLVLDRALRVLRGRLLGWE